MDRSRRYRAQAIIWLVAALLFGTCVPLSILFGKYGFTVLYAANTIMDICLSVRCFIYFRKERKNKNG